MATGEPSPVQEKIEILSVDSAGAKPPGGGRAEKAGAFLTAGIRLALPARPDLDNPEPGRSPGQTDHGCRRRDRHPAVVPGTAGRSRSYSVDRMSRAAPAAPLSPAIPGAGLASDRPVLVRTSSVVRHFIRPVRRAILSASGLPGWLRWREKAPVIYLLLTSPRQGR